MYVSVYVSACICIYTVCLAASRPRLTKETYINERRPAKETYIQQFLRL